MNRKLFTINTFYIIVFALTLFRGFSFYFCCLRTFHTNKIKSMLTVNKLILFSNSLTYIVCSAHLIFCNSSACFTCFFLLDGAEYLFFVSNNSNHWKYLCSSVGFVFYALFYNICHPMRNYALVLTQTANKTYVCCSYSQMETFPYTTFDVNRCQLLKVPKFLKFHQTKFGI